LKAGDSCVDYTVFVHEIVSADESAKRWVIVLVREAPEDEQLVLIDPKQDPLSEAFFEELRERSQSQFETGLSWQVSGLSNGWQLRCHPRFEELLTLLRKGYGYRIDQIHGGLLLPY
jgi:hypothetical protein